VQPGFQCLARNVEVVRRWHQHMDRRGPAPTQQFAQRRRRRRNVPLTAQALEPCGVGIAGADDIHGAELSEHFEVITRDVPGSNDGDWKTLPPLIDRSCNRRRLPARAVVSRRIEESRDQRAHVTTWLAVEVTTWTGGSGVEDWWGLAVAARAHSPS